MEKARADRPSAETATTGDPGTQAPSLRVSAAGLTIQVNKDLRVAVSVVGGKDLFSLPIQVPKLILIGVDSGDFLGKDGQAVALVNQDDGTGEVTITASRPPGTAGVTGTGDLCLLRFKAIAAGNAVIESASSIARDSQQKTMRLQGGETTIRVE